MNEEIKHSFKELLENRISEESIEYFTIPIIQKAYFIGAYSMAVIRSSWTSKVSAENTTFENWLSNQIINCRNLDKIFDMAFRFEQKLKLTLRNKSEVRSLVHGVSVTSSIGFSGSKISYAFVAGFDDYKKFCKKYPTKQTSV